MNTKELRRGAILSYILIIVNTFYGLFFTPFLISSLGSGEYGVYKIMGSFIGSITILDLGIGSTILRYTAKFYAEKESKKLSNFAAMGMIEATGIAIIMVIASVFCYFKIDALYAGALSTFELEKAKELFVLFAVILVLNTYEKVLFSLIAGCEHYAFSNLLKLLRLLLKLVFSVLILQHISDSAVLLKIEIVLLLLCMIIQIIFLRFNIGIKIRLHKWDHSLFLGSFGYTILMFIQSIAVQFNGNLDNMVIGAVIGSTAVAVYSIGLQLYNMYEQFAMAFSDMMLPTVSKQIAVGASSEELENTVIKIGRLEFIVLGGALCGFAIIGQEFINLWLGAEYLFAWKVGLLLMIPTTIPLIQNVCLSILRAKNKMLFRTIAVSIMAVFNFIFTIVGVPIFGAIAACIGTMIGLIGANIIAMNIYYVKVIKLNIFRIFSNILSKTWVCCILSGIVLYFVNQCLYGNWIVWLVKVVLFIVVYGVLLLLFGLKGYERNYILSVLKKRV